MSSATVVAGGVPLEVAGAGRVRQSFASVLLSEWTKLRTVRSTFWSLAVALALAIGLGTLISYLRATHFGRDLADRLHWDPTAVSLTALGLAQLAIVILGIIVVSSEYSTGMIRTSLAAVPKRSKLLAAKALVYALVAVVAGEVMSFAAFFAGQAVIKGHAPSTTIGAHDVLRAVVGAGLYLALVGLLGVGIGAITRHAAGGIGIVVAILFVLPAIANALPTSWQRPVEEYWPTNAGQQVASVLRDPHTLSAWSGFGIMCAFVAVVLAAGFFLLERRDA